MLDVTFTIPLDPPSKSRPRFSNKGGKVRTYTPRETEQAEQVIAAFFRRAAPRHKPDGDAIYGLEATFYCGNRRRRDIDNMSKILMDALNQVAYADDAQIVDLHVRKVYVPKGEARTVARLWEIAT